MNPNTKKLTMMAMFTAIGAVLITAVHFPLFPSAAFLQYDPADVPILICGFAYGPLAGIAWMLPYGVMALCAMVGAVKPGLQMTMLWVFIAAVVVHSVCEILVWKKAVQEK